jgi:hypothetical protein
MKKVEKFQHDLKGYLNSQQSITDMCLDYFQNQKWDKLEKSLQLLSTQQHQEMPKLLSRFNELDLISEEN